MAQNEKYAWGSLITTGLIFFYFQMRMLDGWEVVDVSASAMLVLLGVITVLYIIGEIILAVFVVNKKTGDIERDERDLAIKSRSEQYALWFTNVAIVLLLGQMLITEAGGMGLAPQLDFSALPVLFFCLMSILFVSTLVERIASIVAYRL